MRISLNQLHATAQRALESAGFPYGADDEGASMVVALECFGLQGVSRLLECISGLTQAGAGYPDDPCLQPPKPAGAGAGRFNGAIGCGGLALAPLVVDWCRAQSEGRDGTGRGCVTAAEDGIWYFAAALTAPPGQTFAVGWNEPDGSLWGCRDRDDGVSIYQNKNNEIEMEIEVTCNKKTTPSPPPGYRLWRDAEACRESHRQCVQCGIPIEEQAWRALKQQANKVLVPPTPDSTKHGAGGGDAND